MWLQNWKYMGLKAHAFLTFTIFLLFLVLSGVVVLLLNGFHLPDGFNIINYVILMPGAIFFIYGTVLSAMSYYMSLKAVSTLHGRIGGLPTFTRKVALLLDNARCKNLNVRMIVNSPLIGQTTDKRLYSQLKIRENMDYLFNNNLLQIVCLDRISAENFYANLPPKIEEPEDIDNRYKDFINAETFLHELSPEYHVRLNRLPPFRMVSTDDKLIAYFLNIDDGLDFQAFTATDNALINIYNSILADSMKDRVVDELIPIKYAWPYYRVKYKNYMLYLIQIISSLLDTTSSNMTILEVNIFGLTILPGISRLTDNHDLKGSSEINKILTKLEKLYGNNNDSVKALCLDDISLEQFLSSVLSDDEISRTLLLHEQCISKLRNAILPYSSTERSLLPLQLFICRYELDIESNERLMGVVWFAEEYSYDQHSDNDIYPNFRAFLVQDNLAKFFWELFNQQWRDASK